MVIESHPHIWSEGDTKPVLKISVASGGTAVDITGWVITLRMRRATDVLTKVAVITDGVGGLAEIQWVAGDLLGGEHRAEITLDNGTAGEETTKKFNIEVQERIS